MSRSNRDLHRQTATGGVGKDDWHDGFWPMKVHLLLQFIDAGGGSVVECANEFRSDFLPQPACGTRFWANNASKNDSGA